NIFTKLILFINYSMSLIEWYKLASVYTNKSIISFYFPLFANLKQVMKFEFSANSVVACRNLTVLVEFLV
ncbi:hypothetical protein A499_10519, partial [Niallia nealsonii AAU1]